MQRIGLLIAAMVAILGGLQLAAATPPQTRYRVEPGNVVKDNPANPALTTVGGTFTLVEANDGVPPHRMDDGRPFVTGGACMVYQDRDEAFACTKQSDCEAHAPAGGFAYCDAGAEHPTCWLKDASTRNGFNEDQYLVDDRCIKSGFDKSLIADKVNTLPTGPARRAGALRQKLRWRVMTCQGLVQGGCRDQVREGATYTLRFGSIKQP